MTANLTETITELENQTWQALQRSGKDFLPYLAEDFQMLLPLGMRITQTSSPNIRTIMNSEAFEPWQSYKMEDVEVMSVGTEGAVISYRAEATKSDRDPMFRALITSVWRKDSSGPSGQWLLCCHQQTPFEEEL